MRGAAGVNTQGQPCGTLHFQDLLEEAKRMKMLRDPLFWLIALFVARFSGYLIASRCLLPCSHNCHTRLSARKFCSSGTGSFLAGGISSLFAVIIGTGAGIAVTRRGVRNFAHWWKLLPPLGRLFARRGAGDCRSGDRLWSETSDIALILYGVLPVLQATLAGLERLMPA